MIIVHHLDTSQSERIIWLLEELGLPYSLEHYQRDPVTRLAPPALREVHELGSAPIIQDGDVTLAESGAIVEYILHRYAEGTLQPAVADATYPAYLYWFHYANGGLMQIGGIMMVLTAAGGLDSPVGAMMKERVDRHLNMIDRHFSNSAYCAGETFTAADIMLHFGLATMRAFHPLPIGNRAGIRGWLDRISERENYQRAMRRAGHATDPALPDAA